MPFKIFQSLIGARPLKPINTFKKVTNIADILNTK